MDGQRENICRLMIDIGDDRTVKIFLNGKLIPQNSGPPQAAATAGDAEQKEKEDKEKKEKEEKEFLMQMRGWLMTVGTLFVTIAFQAALQPPAWLRTTDFLRLGQSDIDQRKHPFHGASHAAVTPARFTPSPSPSPQAAESTTASLSARAWAYMMCNYITFGCSLALMLMLIVLRNERSRQAKFIMSVATFMLLEISFFVVCTVVVGTSENWRFTIFAFGVIQVCGWVISGAISARLLARLLAQLYVISGAISARLRARPAG